LLAAAGYNAQKPLSFKVMISNSGSGQMVPLPMNEVLQRNLKQACGVEVKFDVVEWQVLSSAGRLGSDNPGLHGAMAVNASSASTDIGMMVRYFAAANFSPAGNNFAQWKDDQFEAAMDTAAKATDDATIQASFRTAHQRLVDNPPWLYIVHDLNPRALNKKVHGLVSAQSWLIDLTLISLR
jgi:ABC-type transport system substrate-binding protein